MKEENTYYDGIDGLNLPGSLRVNPFVVPEDYFSHLTERIAFHVKTEKYRDAAPAAWRVPPGYFEELSDKILVQTKIDQAEKSEAFHVPVAYFDGLSERMQRRVFEEKLKEQVPADGFNVPEGYQEMLRDKILAQTVGNEKRNAPVRSINFKKWMPYAAAACVALGIGIGSYYTQDHTTEVHFAESQLATIPNEEIVNYLTALNDSDDMLYVIDCIDHAHHTDGICTHVQENDIEDYLNYAL